MGCPYGWGGMYFYNNCSAELKSLFTPFGFGYPGILQLKCMQENSGYVQG